MSRPSVKACTTRSVTPSSAASSITASMCSQPEWTPPSEISPIACRRPRAEARACAQAPFSAGFSKKEPSAIASSIRARSCFTTAPAPRLRWPDLGVPHLARREADVAARGARASCAGSASQSSSKIGRLRLGDRVARARPAPAPSRRGRSGPPRGPASPPARRPRAHPGRRLDDREEVARVEAGAADEGAVDVVLADQLGRVVGLDRAAVEDPDRARRRRRCGRRPARGSGRSPPGPGRGWRSCRSRSPRSARRRSRPRRAGRRRRRRGRRRSGGSARPRSRRPRARPPSRRRRGSARSPASSAAGTFRARASSVSPKCSRRSEWPRITPWTPSSSQHRRRDLAGEGAAVGLVHVLGRDRHSALRRSARPPSSATGRAGRSRPRRPRRAPSAGRRRGSSRSPRPSCSSSSSPPASGPASAGRASIGSESPPRPGSSLPSTNSSEAPPPVESQSTLSARPNSAIAAAESPPPTTVWPGAAATASRDRAGAGGERLQLEGAHRPVPEDRLRPPRSASRSWPRCWRRCRAPSSPRGRRRRSAPAPRCRRRTPGRAPGPRAAPGSPRSSRHRRRSSRAASTLSSSTSESPVSRPSALKKLKHIAPPIRISCAESRKRSITPILSVTLAPPRTMISGRSGSSRTLRQLGHLLLQQQARRRSAAGARRPRCWRGRGGRRRRRR